MFIQNEIEIFSAVADINSLIIDRYGDKDCEEGYYLYITTDVFCYNIDFLGKIIWSSENDERKFDEEKDEYEPLIVFLKRAYNQEIEKIQKQKICYV